jgi:2-aminoethylphosphonate dioxygenase
MDPTVASPTVTPAQLASYSRDGYLVLPRLFDPAEAARLAAWTDEVSAWPEVPGRHMVYWEPHRHEPGRRVRSRIENFHPYHAGFRATFDEGPLAAVAAALLEGPAVLFKDKINFKMPGGDRFEPHQDQQAGWSTYNRRADGDHRLRYYADKRRSFPPDCEREPGREYVYRV